MTLAAAALALLAAQQPDDPLLSEAALAANEYRAQLPDCRQVLDRGVSPHRRVKWQHVDNITSEVAYEQGHEVHRSIVRAGKPVSEVEDLLDQGPWSEGEWGHVLGNVFDPDVRTTFLDAGPYSIKGSRGRKYTFAVLEARSRWQITAGRRTVLPAYSGTVWVDAKSRKVVRLQKEARGLPDDFPLDVVELDLDFGWVTIEGKRYLLPVRTASLVCHREEWRCNLNVTIFRDHRKFEAQSRIVP